MEIKFAPIIPTIPKFTELDLAYVANQALTEFAREVKDELDSTTETWKKPVKFIIRYDRANHSVRVFTNDEIYGYVNEGTAPHAIAPIGAKTLKFKSGYRAKTMPGRIKATSGGKFGDNIFATGVWHPGIKGRHFSGLIYQKMIQTGRFNKIFGNLLTNYLKRWK
jgi:hypothetical protein